MTTKRFESSGKPTQEALTEEKQLQQLYPGYQGIDEDYVHASMESLERFEDWKYGLRIHWGPYSVIGVSIGESWLLVKIGHPKHLHSTLPILRSQYEQIANYWNPAGFDAEQWCRMMVKAGMKYFTFTTKHHDGFSMYDSKTVVKKRLVHVGQDAGRHIDFNRHYSIMETPFGRDVTRELVEAGRRHDLGIGLYFSHIDWFDPDFRIDESNYQFDRNYTRKADPAGFDRMIKRHRQQILELCTNYGPIDLLSLDMSFMPESGVNKDIIETVKMARRLQPQMLMRNRGIGPYGDYKTPEGVVPRDPNKFDADDDAAPLAVSEKLQQIPWKVIFSCGKCMSYVWGDEYKPASWIIETLVDVVSKGGNFQVGFGPGPFGTWDKTVIERLEEVGNWLKVNGQAIYETRPYKTFAEGKHIRFTRTKDGKFVYVFFLRWPDLSFAGGTVSINSVRAKPGSAIGMPGLEHSFSYTQNAKSLVINIPDWFSDPSKRPCNSVYVFRVEVAK